MHKPESHPTIVYSKGPAENQSGSMLPKQIVLTHTDMVFEVAVTGNA